MPTYSGHTTPTHTEGGIDEKFVRNYTAHYVVVSSEHDDDPGTIAALCPGIVWGSYWAVDVYALCRTKNAVQRQGDLGTWDVTVTYSSAPVDQGQIASGGGSPTDPGSANNNVQPDNRSWSLTISSSESTRILEYDVITNAEVTASNGQRFDPPIEVPKYMSQFSFEGWKALGADSFANHINFQGRVNQGVWNDFGGNFPEYSLLCKSYQLQYVFEPGWGWYWKKNVTMLYNPELWNPIKVLDAGTYERESLNTPPYKPILDNSGQPVTSPVPLNGSGRPLNAGDAFVYREFNGYLRRSFSGII